MDVIEAILTRRSIRKFTSEPVSELDLATILKAGFHAPSAHNYQPREYIVIKEKEKFEKIACNHTYAKMLPEADLCIIVCGDMNKQPMKGFLIEDCSAAIQNILLAAHGLGLGAVWCGLHPVEELTKDIKEICNLPEYIEPIGMVVLGHKGEDKKVKDKYDSTKIHYEVW